MIDDLDEGSFDQLLDGGKLPAIERHLASKGTRFTDSFVTESACCPSRASFLTGQYPHNHGVQNVDGENGGYMAFHTRHPLGAERPTLARWLKDHGYFTAMIGKYMNGYSTSTAPLPAFWDLWRALADPAMYRLDPGAYYLVRETGEVTQPDVYQTRHVGDLGICVINDDRACARNSRPFLLYLAPTAPHVVEGVVHPYQPGDCSERPPYRTPHPQFEAPVLPDREGYRGYTKADYRAYGCAASGKGGYPFMCLREKDGSPLPGYDLPGLHAASYDNFLGVPAFVPGKWEDLRCDGNEKNLRRQHSERLESVLSIDLMVGQVVGALEARGLLDQTLIIFTSDNGFMLGEHRLGNKLFFYDEAIRVPLIIRAPGQTRPLTVEQLALNIDLAPTILDYAGLPWQSAAYGVDGRSLKPLMEQADVSWRDWFVTEVWHPRGYEPSDMNHGHYWWISPDFAALRTATHAGESWKNMIYVEFHDPAWPDEGRTYEEYLLFDMDEDPFQTRNLYGNEARHEELDRLKQVLDVLRDCAGQACRDLDGRSESNRSSAGR
jgi:arylsulfatase A-like enzyme